MALKLGFMDGDENNRRRKQFKSHEKKVATALGGIGTIGSGNKGMKGDVWAGDRDAGQRLMVECKMTEKDAVQLKLAWIRKLVREAREASHEPVLALRLHFEGAARDYGMVPLNRALVLDPPLAERTCYPDSIMPGEQGTYNHRWFTVMVDSDFPGVIAFAKCGPTVPYAWAVYPLDRLKELFAQEAARLRAA